MSNATLPAILGGAPVRTRPYPPVNFIGPSEKALANEVLDSGVLSAYVAHNGPWFGGGAMVKALEEEFCKIFGVRYAVSVNSATSGLHCALAAALVGPGDEVLVPPYTMSASATMISVTGAVPVFVDIEPDSFCLDPAEVRKKISPRTKAIMAVNIFGGPANLAELRKIADEHKLVLIEDNSQSPWGTFDGKFTGTWGEMGVFSLNCHKTIQSGEGGVIVTNDETLADRMRLFRNHGENVLAQRETVPAEIEGMLGFNYRLSELHSAVALGQVRRLPELTQPRIEMAEILNEQLRGIDGLTTPFVGKGNRHVYYVYPMRIDAERFGLSRRQLKRALDAEGVAAIEGYVKPIYLYPMFSERVKAQARGFGAGTWHPAEGTGVTYGPGLCPVTEAMHFQELLYTNILRADLGRPDALEFSTAIRRVYEHRHRVREELSRQGTV